MSVIASFTLPAEEFMLGRTLEVHRGVRVRLESMIPTGETRVPYFWVDSDDADAVAAALRESPTTSAARVVDEVDGETLFRVDWAGDVNGLIGTIHDAEAIVLEGVGMGDEWSFSIRFPTNENLSRFYQTCVEKGISLDLDRIDSPVTSGGDGNYGLTGPQQETLLTALDAGYFDVPRETTLVELAERLGISDSAVSQRLRRGLTTLLTSTLIQRSTGQDDVGET
ncbi:MAG: bacterio-opsin activator domain-containing protein [Salinigranum sp.]